mmetsp:Transcript_20328/g.54303  ORF Transcript_20328/g.54303 Transcript_20328/m.54303 type:complete len:223 (-) Transcript_20328:327-995(-)
MAPMRAVASKTTSAKGVRKDDVTKKSVQLTKSGQHSLRSGLCIATSREGKPCCRGTSVKGVPYCEAHMLRGDPSLRVAEHPKCGKILVAARDLPRGYRVVLWGRLCRRKNMSPEALEWGFELMGTWMLDPTGNPGSLVQFCACPGPGEIAALWTDGAGRQGKEFGSRTFVLPFGLTRNWQATMQYGDNTYASDEFFKDRGLVRMDVGTKRYPAMRRADDGKK